jgi:hypothetical protein
MNTKIIKFETIRWASIAAVLAVVSYGFFIPISIMQALAYNPMMIICLLAIIGYATGRIEGIKQTADVYHLDINNKHEQQTIRKAA